ncbi:general secretion pathway protein M [Methylosinus sp. sav-2]|uniref:type II secretion system protein GspM n=1 Tax=Methylosinus sp. sav-2 TaxID=2485168 RepID=UPI0010667405|nr:type II secretion system protein GspM [Methylosinus sp. sav-2]TDX61390.1 general secretion pathway protein M [Methylosinus sp. sav-2]
MRLDLPINREEGAALGALAALVLVCGAAALFALGGRGGAAEENAQRRDALARLEAAQKRAGGPGDRAVAPEAAFLAAPTAALAGAQLQAYVTRLVAAQHAALTSSNAPPPMGKEAADAVQLQATFDMELSALQALLYELEAGTPYVFVEAFSLQPLDGARRGGSQPLLRVTLNLRAHWRRTAS